MNRLTKISIPDPVLDLLISQRSFHVLTHDHRRDWSGLFTASTRSPRMRRLEGTAAVSAITAPKRNPMNFHCLPNATVAHSCQGDNSLQANSRPVCNY